MSDPSGNPSKEVHPSPPPPPTKSTIGVSHNPRNQSNNSNNAEAGPSRITPMPSGMMGNAENEEGDGGMVIDPDLLALDGMEGLDEDLDMMDGGFDQDTLANLAALSRIDQDDTPEEDGGGEETGVQEEQGRNERQREDGQKDGVRIEHDDTSQTEPDRVKKTSEHMAQNQNQLSSRDLEAKGKNEREGTVEMALNSSSQDGEGEGEDEDGEGDEESGAEDLNEMRSDQKDGNYDERPNGDGGGKGRRRRHRTMLSCTECHRRCDRNIPCNRCIKRGIPTLCRMEAPILPHRKKRKVKKDDFPIDYELSLRVQALENLIRSGSSLDPDSASSAALETIMQATKAANMGNAEAGHALSNLSSMAGSEIESGERSGMLLEVMQQLTSASTKPKESTKEPVVEVVDDPWSSVPKARAPLLPEYKPPEKDEDDPDLTSPTIYPHLDLTMPGFREDNGKPFVPPSVKFAEKQVIKNDPQKGFESVLSHHLPIQGHEGFVKEGTKFAYGSESAVWKKDHIAAIQANSLPMALRVAGTFLNKFPLPSANSRAIYLPSPTSAEDEIVLREAGLEIRRFRYVDQDTGLVNFEGVRNDLQNATPRSAVLLYCSGTVPTGIELNASQWRLLSTILLEKQLIPLCIMAFQGLISGDPEKDAQHLKFMIHEGLPVILIQSFDTTMGLFADSPAIISIASQTVETKSKIDTQLRLIAKTLCPHPSPWGAQIAHMVLSDQRINQAWLNEMRTMSDRLRDVREALYNALVNRLKTPGDWHQIRKSSGLFCSTLLPLTQIQSISQHRNIHLHPSGSFSLGSLNSSSIHHLASSIDWVIRESIREQEESQAQAIAMELALTAAREAAQREEEEAAERAALEAEEKAREEDTMLMEMSIRDAMELQRREEEEESKREEERREMDEAIRKAAERAEIQRRAEEILASIGAGMM